jgi:hypothetical protein
MCRSRATASQVGTFLNTPSGTCLTACESQACLVPKICVRIVDKHLNVHLFAAARESLQASYSALNRLSRYFRLLYQGM